MADGEAGTTDEATARVVIDAARDGLGTTIGTSFEVLYSGIVAGLRRAREEERARIVEWLRDEIAELRALRAVAEAAKDYLQAISPDVPILEYVSRPRPDIQLAKLRAALDATKGGA